MVCRRSGAKKTSAWTEIVPLSRFFANQRQDTDGSRSHRTTRKLSFQWPGALEVRRRGLPRCTWAGSLWKRGLCSRCPICPSWKRQWSMSLALIANCCNPPAQSPAPASCKEPSPCSGKARTSSTLFGSANHRCLGGRAPSPPIYTWCLSSFSELQHSAQPATKVSRRFKPLNLSSLAPPGSVGPSLTDCSRRHPSAYCAWFSWRGSSWPGP